MFSALSFQSPRGDFGFLKLQTKTMRGTVQRTVSTFQSPRGDFGFLKEEAAEVLDNWTYGWESFNPLAGILVF